MKKIQMVDLKGQYEGIKDQINNSFNEIFETTAFINGTEVQQFQKELEEYLGVKHVIPCANGTDALQIAMMGLGLKLGDEVITADFTFAATVEVIALLQLTPVLVDVDPRTFNIDTEAIKQAITPKTKAIVPVHLFGQVANMDAIMAIAQEHNLYVIEDNAQAIGANYHSEHRTLKAGAIGHVGATSFFPSKNLGAYGDGGALFTNDDELAHTIRGIVNHGMYERYHHDVVGVNSRLDSFQAAVLRAKLPRLDMYNEARKKSALKYDEAFRGIEGIEIPYRGGDYDTHVFHQYTLKIKDGKRDALAKHLQQEQIPFGVYYPIPLHLQKAYVDDRYLEKDFTVTNKLVKEVLSLPMHTELEDDQIEYITSTIISFLKNN
ncbi:DegT/DnrJ/EryC1/StrS family aminotransferase [Gramella sp. AN32]|uniref:DegT/DnrJ/EryC1/StrS family aminotransferase n=1 Tax=Christiangramia antarctica TaxID=2058158 RepID=A0ABW5X3T0_9FLAO|nr:DegT/DnrJ/EryC1/StrS family aminotransferase [Gramella sp. AN32]MCM4157728.1 transcriptional regulator [Gramella sp. AN32]